MTFWIQAGNPALLKAYDGTDSNLGEAMETIFPIWAENAYMVWNHIHIPLGYSSDLSLMILDAMEMCEAILDADGGEKIIGWPSNTFRVDWHLKWDYYNIVISGKFHSVQGGCERQLELNPEVSLSKIDFLSEWKLPFSQIVKYLEIAGYSELQVSELKRLRSVAGKIPTFGILYRNVI